MLFPSFLAATKGGDEKKGQEEAEDANASQSDRKSEGEAPPAAKEGRRTNKRGPKAPGAAVSSPATPAPVPPQCEEVQRRGGGAEGGGDIRSGGCGGDGGDGGLISAAAQEADGAVAVASDSDAAVSGDLGGPGVALDSGPPLDKKMRR